MPTKIKPNKQVNGYEIIEMVNNGAMAMSYRATSPDGELVFFKQYKSPTVKVAWYDKYVDYQREMKHRLENTPAKNFAYKMVDFFEAKYGAACYFQVFEFVTEGHDLEEALQKIRDDPASISWEQRVLFAKVIMASINAFHTAKIVHCDLKPPNIQLIKDDSIKAGYMVKLIDLDFSILSDRQAPWHGHQGYVGTPDYLSPEHSDGDAPVAASDVFTCGLILYELLAGEHPYRFGDPVKYEKAIRKHRAKPPKLAGKMEAPANNDDVAAVLHRCLSPDPAARPTARDVVLVLNGKPIEGSPVEARPIPVYEPDSPEEESDPDGPTPETRDESDEPAEAPVDAPVSVPQIALVGDGHSAQFGIRTEVGKYLCKQFGEDSQFFDTLQFTLEPDIEGRWLVVPNRDAKNETMLNGKAIVDSTPVGDGDVLAVGRESKGITKLPLTVQIS